MLSFLFKKPKTTNIIINGENIVLLVAQGFSNKKTGLLNHLSLQKNEGLMFTRTYLLHSFGMHFDILLVALNKRGEIIAPPKIMPPNTFAFVSLAAHSICEMHPCWYDYVMVQAEQNKKQMTMRHIYVR